MTNMERKEPSSLGVKDRPLGIALLEKDSTIFRPRKVAKAQHHVGCM
jgi:hypothetical protein